MAAILTWPELVDATPRELILPPPPPLSMPEGNPEVLAFKPPSYEVRISAIWLGVIGHSTFEKCLARPTADRPLIASPPRCRPLPTGRRCRPSPCRRRRGSPDR